MRKALVLQWKYIMKDIVSIILLNYNWKQFNKSCIDSILAQNYQDFEIIFVDQCSTDWSLKEVGHIYQKEIKSWKIKIVKNTENNWFTGWNNLWVKHADKNSKYIWLLNNDTVVQKDWLEKLVQSIEKDNELWAVSCLILNKWFEEKEKKQILIKHKKCVSTIFWESVYENMTQTEIESKFYYTTTLSWCCFLYKKNIIEEPFPQYYFAYAEDMYLSRLIICMWYKLWVCLDTYINHYGSWSFWSKPSKLKLFHGNKNQIINFLIFYPLFYRILLFPLFIIKEIAHLFMWVPLMRLNAKIKWWLWTFKNYNRITKTRNLINRHKGISNYQFFKLQKSLLTDQFFFENRLLKFFVYIWNIIFWVYGKIFIVIIYFTSLF